MLPQIHERMHMSNAYAFLAELSKEATREMVGSSKYPIEMTGQGPSAGMRLVVCSVKELDDYCSFLKAYVDSEVNGAVPLVRYYQGKLASLQTEIDEALEKEDWNKASHRLWDLQTTGQRLQENLDKLYSAPG